MDKEKELARKMKEEKTVFEIDVSLSINKTVKQEGETEEEAIEKVREKAANNPGEFFYPHHPAEKRISIERVEEIAAVEK